MTNGVKTRLLPNGYGLLNWMRLPLAWIAILFCVIAIVFLASDVRNRLSALEAANSDNLQWNVMQTEVEALRLEQAISYSQQVAGTTAEAAALDDVRRWFNVYYSRSAMLENSEIHGAQLAQPAYAEDQKTIHGFLNAAVPLIDGGDPALIAALPSLAEGAARLREASRSITLKSLAEFSAQSDIEREQISTTLLRLAAVVAFLMLVLVTFSVGTARLYRTARQQAEALRLTGGRLSTIVFTSADGIVVTDRDGIVQEFNPAAETIFGIPRDQALGINALDQLFADDPEGRKRGDLMSALDSTVLAGRGPLRVEVDGRRSDGSVFPAEVSIATTRPSDEQLLVAFVRDISNRRRAQTELQAALERAVAGEQAKARFLAVMSHEMRTPLNGLIGSMALLDEMPLGPEQREVLRVMETSGSILLEHVNSVLDISRAEAGAMQIAQIPFDLDQLIEEVAANQAGLAASAGNRISITALGGPVGRVTGDPTRIRQVMLNLIGNAVKFTSDGEITVETERLPCVDALQGQETVEIRVIDTGIGIAEEDIDRIFEDFVTLDTRYERITNGTGLGLGITRRLIEAMGGEIGVESESGEGSLFWLRLPLPPANRDSDQPQSGNSPAKAMAEGSLSPAPETDAPAGPPMDILVVEDNEINRFLLRRYLESAGHSVTEAFDGGEGVTKAAERCYDVILMDISMPRMDGVEATRRIRAGQGASAKSRILALTAHALPEELDRFRAAGMESTLTKPIGRQDLLAALWTSSAHPAKAVATPAEPAADIVVNRTALTELRQQIGPATAATLIRRLIDDGDAALAVLQDAPPDGRGAEIAARCHQLSGVGGTFGTVALRHALTALEHRIGRGEISGIDADIAALAQIWQETRQIMADAATDMETTAP